MAEAVDPQPEVASKQLAPTSSAELTAALLVAAAVSAVPPLCAPRLPFSACFLSVPLALLSVLWLVWAIVRTRFRGWDLLAVLVVSGLAWGALALSQLRRPLGGSPLAVGNVPLTVCAAALGVFLAGLVRDRNILVPAGIFAAAIDIAVVYWGPTGRAVEAAPRVVTRLSVHTALPGTGGPPPVPGAPPSPLEVLNVGAVDVLLAAFMLAALLRFGMRAWPAFWQICVWCSLVSLTVVVKAWPIPGWPFVVLGALLPNRDQFHFSRSEKVAMAIAFVVAVAAVRLVLWATARMW